MGYFALIKTSIQLDCIELEDFSSAEQINYHCSKKRSLRHNSQSIILKNLSTMNYHSKRFLIIAQKIRDAWSPLQHCTGGATANIQSQCPNLESQNQFHTPHLSAEEKQHLDN